MTHPSRSPNIWLLGLSAVLLLVVVAQLLGLRTLSQALERTSQPPAFAGAHGTLPSSVPYDADHAPLFTQQGQDFWRHHAQLFEAPSPAGPSSQTCIDGAEAFGAEVPSVSLIEHDDRVEVHLTGDGSAPADIEAVLVGQHLSVSGPVDAEQVMGDQPPRFARMLFLPQPVNGAAMQTEVRDQTLVIVLPLASAPI